MRVSARIDYACKALLELSLNWPKKEALQLNFISDKQNIPKRYLVQILNQLKRMGLVESIRGPEGGYLLKVEPKKIKLSKVLVDIGGPLLPVSSSIENRHSVFESVWAEVEEAIEKVLGEVNFEDICNKFRDSANVLFYNI